MTPEEQERHNQDVRFMAGYLREQVAIWYAIAVGLPDSQNNTKMGMRKHGDIWLTEANAWEQLFVKPVLQEHSPR